MFKLDKNLSSEIKNLPIFYRPLGPDPILLIGFLKPISITSTDVLDKTFK